MPQIRSLDDFTTALSKPNMKTSELITILEDVIGMEATKLQTAKILGDKKQRVISEITICQSKVLLSFLRIQNDSGSA